MAILPTLSENWAVVKRTTQRPVAVETEVWRHMRLPPPPPSSNPLAAGFDDFPTIFTVLCELGLELKRQEATVPVHIVERIERPAAE